VSVPDPVPAPSQLPEPIAEAVIGMPFPPETAMHTTHVLHTADLWQRVRNGFKMPDLNIELVREQERFYATRSEDFARMSARSRKYLFYIVEELALRNMPTELALLPFIESGYNPQAVSSAKAVGMWQFMPETGKDYELAKNHFRDERRDVSRSTSAALTHLGRLYVKFGDWHLALASYNWGEGNVERAIAKNRRASKPTGYVDLDMPLETRLYVPKLQAIKNIVAVPGAFNVKLPLIEDHPFFRSVTITRDLDVKLAAKFADVSLEDFKVLNAGVHRPVLLAAGTPQILLPWKNAHVFEQKIQSHGGIALASWTVWVVPYTLRAADVAKRVGMREQELREVNEIPAGKVIRAGSALLIRRKHSGAPNVNVSAAIANMGQMVLDTDVPAKKRINRPRPKAQVGQRQSATVSKPKSSIRTPRGTS
jgi:membrane-bound lytic murein transglycosylase D